MQRTSQQLHNTLTMTHTHTLHTLFIICIFLTGCVCGSDLTVWQTPDIINTTEGEDVNIICHFIFRPNSTQYQLTVVWLRNNGTKQNEQIINASQPTTSEVVQTVVLNLPSVHQNHSDVYYCKVWQVTPTLGNKTKGNGTKLIVGAGSDLNLTAQKNDSTVIIITASVLSSVLITVCITVICFLHKRCHKKPKEQREDQPVQVEDTSSVLYAALNILKPQDKKNPPQTTHQSDTECVTDAEVLYADVRIKSKNQRHTPEQT